MEEEEGEGEEELFAGGRFLARSACFETNCEATRDPSSARKRYAPSSDFRCIVPVEIA